ncbi:integrase catalytic domain-containing protein [Trichonephila clavipes]|nr:integrase catalytic domain-containing protein [Trichonephila clavipes]
MPPAYGECTRSAMANHQSAAKKEIKGQVEKLLQAGLIKESNCPYSAPVTLAFKREEGKKTRLCIDFRKLNALCKADFEPLPIMDSLLDKTKLLDQVCSEYNSTPHSITKYPPACLLFGLLPYQSPIDLNNYYEPVDEACELPLQRTINYHIKNKIRYDACCIEKNINPADLVVYEEFQYPIIRAN